MKFWCLSHCRAARAQVSLMRKLTRAFAARSHRIWMKMKTQKNNGPLTAGKIKAAVALISLNG